LHKIDTRKKGNKDSVTFLTRNSLVLVCVKFQKLQTMSNTVLHLHPEALLSVATS